MPRSPRLATGAALLGGALAAALSAQQPTPTPDGSDLTRPVRDIPSTEEAKTELKAVDWSVMKYVQQKDRAALEKLLAPDFTIMRLVEGHALVVGSREAFLKSEQTLHGYLFVESDVRLYGEMGTVTSRLALESTLSNGVKRSGEFFIVDLWRKSGFEWQLVARYSSPAEKAAQ